MLKETRSFQDPVNATAATLARSRHVYLQQLCGSNGHVLASVNDDARELVHVIGASKFGKGHVVCCSSMRASDQEPAEVALFLVTRTGRTMKIPGQSPSDTSEIDYITLNSLPADIFISSPYSRSFQEMKGEFLNVAKDTLASSLNSFGLGQLTFSAPRDPDSHVELHTGMSTFDYNLKHGQNSSFRSPEELLEDLLDARTSSSNVQAEFLTELLPYGRVELSRFAHLFETRTGEKFERYCRRVATETGRDTILGIADLLKA